MKRHYFALQPSEQIIVTAAAGIYAAYISAGRVEAGHESEWMDVAIKAAIRIAMVTDQSIQADQELD